MFFRLFLLMRKEFLQFFRNVPLLVIVLYCMTLDVYMAGDVSMDINNYPLAIYDMDCSEQTRDVISRLRKPYFEIAHIINEESQIEELIEEGTISVVVVFPHDFGKKISSYQPAEMQLIMDGSKSNASELALGYISGIVREYNEKVIFTTWKVSAVEKKVVPYVDCRLRYLYNPNLIDRWSFSLQEFFIDITLIGILLIATAMVNEKQFGTIEQLMVTPLRTWEIMASKVVPMSLILLVAAFMSVFAVLKPFVGVPLLGSVWQLFFVTLIYIFTIAGLGLLISTISSNLSDTVLFSILILVPMMFLSGAFVPIESMPVWMRILVRFSPLKYYIDLGNAIFLKGNSIFLMWKEVISLFVLGAVTFFLGAFRFRKAFR